MKVTAITVLRGNGVHISGLMLMCHIQRLTARTNTAFLGELVEYYHKETLNQNLRPYSRSGINYMLNRLIVKGYVIKDIEKSYHLTWKGKHAVSMFTS